VAARARATCAEPSRQHEAHPRSAAGEGVHQRISELSRDLPELVDSAARGAGATDATPKSRAPPHFENLFNFLNMAHEELKGISAMTRLTGNRPLLEVHGESL